MLTNVHIKSNIVPVSVFPMGGFSGWPSVPRPPQPLSCEILYYFLRILRISWQASRPPLSEFSGSAPVS